LEASKEDIVESEKAPLKTIGFYRQTLAKNLSKDVFKPNPKRLIWFSVSLITSLSCFFLIVRGNFPWPIKVIFGLVAGCCNGILAFISHELFHGSIVRSQRAQTILGFFGALPFFISPTFWRFWHNKLHHGKTQQLIRDPDAFPNLRIYKSSRFMKMMFPYTPGSGHKRSISYFFFWFSFHNFVAQTYLRFRNSVFETLDQKQVTLEFGLQVLIAIGLLAYAGPRHWVYVLLIPLVVQNYLLMSYISTNHNLSPLTNQNDPLMNSLTVTNFNFLEFMHLNFGYHVEHHIFPTVNPVHAKVIHRELLKAFPENFQVMTKWKAVKALYATSRIYKSSHELINPETKNIYKTIT
jgi:fatty acid desaturase